MRDCAKCSLRISRRVAPVMNEDKMMKEVKEENTERAAL